MKALLACCMLGGCSMLDLHGPLPTTAAAAHMRLLLSNMENPSLLTLYFQWQWCRTSLLIFSFFILSPSLFCVCVSLLSVLCLSILHPCPMDGLDSTTFLVMSSIFLHFILALHQCWNHLHGLVTSSLCMPSRSVCPLWPLLSPPCPSLQHWDQGGGHSEEPERLIAHTRLQAGPQSALLSATSGPEPKPAHRLGVPQHSLPAGQTPLQLSPLFPFFISLSLSPSLQLSQHFLSLLFCFLLQFFPPLGEELCADNAEFSLVDSAVLSKGPDVFAAKLVFRSSHRG